ncbi:MAG: ABC transporter permease [Planctomycetes bacterium]|nr:ABC transporter permease [Planctomycetota bacterium]
MRRTLNNYGMILVLLALCLLFSLLTLKRQVPTGSAAAKELVARIVDGFGERDVILVVGAVNKDTAPLAEETGMLLRQRGFSNVRVVVGTPRDLRLKLDRITADGEKLAAIATGGDVIRWGVIEQLPEKFPQLATCRLVAPQSRLWPTFLKRSNLLAIVDRIIVIAIIAIGMTMVIITAGIDLSVGSLIALSAVAATLTMKALGGASASGAAVWLGFLAGILCCGLVGCGSGLLVAYFKVAPFIVTLGVMMMARGLAFLLTGGFSIYQVPEALPWLGQGRSLGVPNTVILLIGLFLAAHIFMTHTRLGRYIYAVGGNEEAARLSGVPVKLVIVFVYAVSALCAGLGGCIQASQLNTGTPSMGVMYELYVIAAVVVGGTSLSGGSGRVLGTLIGAFIISVIQNGMNLLGMESYTQQVVLGTVILAAVLLDKARSSRSMAPFLTGRKGSLPRS